MRKQLIALLAGAAVMLVTTAAMAVPITGTINFAGGLKLTGPAAVDTIANATGIDFIDPAFVSYGAEGTYAGIPLNTQVFFQDFDFAPILNPTPVSPLWTLTSGGTTFDFLLNTVATSYADNSLILNGTGILRGTDFDDTLGSWSLTTQGSSSILSFSATSTVPEPGTMLLLGAGFLGLAIYGKRRKNA